MNVAVLGVGGRGRDLTRRCVRAGHEVRLYANDANAVMDAVDTVDQTLDVPVTDYVTGTTDLHSAVDGAALVADATDGDTARRRELLAEVETAIGDETLVATGDATVSVTAVAAGLQTPGRAVGINFLDSPDPPLVEVVLAEQTTTNARDRATAFVRGLDCVPVIVGDGPGFAGARLELAAVAEAIRMVEAEVASTPDIDRVATRGADRGGPLARADELGLDAVLDSLAVLSSRLGPQFDPPDLLRRAVDAGRLGASTGEGFYVWTNGRPDEPSDLNPTLTGRSPDRDN
ncbi:3-hydroxyacyl-CoA dehydrogenase family protein [Haloarcula marina]|uniref:3-hydroxyacyl-CoA dehydrogenase family protein n=1 Tax=Haloarcula marina TaxID=2961574 RepID=UPI0020B7C1F7|nr:3-hydroxyacyl-CoA dehydrogenase family protein [Halomicroarcula marina]